VAQVAVRVIVLQQVAQAQQDKEITAATPVPVKKELVVVVAPAAPEEMVVYHRHNTPLAMEELGYLHL
jgi:hypothetical protein